MSRRQRVGLALGVALLLAALAGCSAPQTLETPGGRIVAVSDQASDIEEQALAEGTVAWGNGGCLVIEADETYLIMFPHGTTVDDDDGVILPGGYRISAGDEVALGGGFHSTDTTNGGLTAIPEKCLTEEIFWASGEVTE